MTWILLSLLFSQIPAPDSPIIFPDIVVPAPKPINLDLPIAIKLDEMYVVQSDTELFIRQSPKNRLSIEKESGPIKVRGNFVGSNDKSKTFTKKFVYIVTVTDTKESGLSDLFFVPKGVAADKEIIQRAIDAQVGPRPPPDPPPGPKPDPTPVNPSPFAGDGLRCLIVYETADLTRMPASQQQILFAKSIRTYLDSKSPLGIDGKTHDWRIYDQNIDTTADSQTFKDAMNRPRKSVPWIIVGNGKTGFEGPLPATVDDTLTLLRKYGG